MSNPRKPSQFKVISGTFRKDREPPSVLRLPLVDTVPEAPDWLPNIHARKEWDRFAAILYANKILTTAAVSTLGVLCGLHGKLVQKWMAGETPSGHALSQYRNLMNDFGLTPVALGRIRVKGPSGGNKFSGNGRRTTD